MEGLGSDRRLKLLWNLAVVDMNCRSSCNSGDVSSSLSRSRSKVAVVVVAAVVVVVVAVAVAAML